MISAYLTEKTADDTTKCIDIDLLGMEVLHIVVFLSGR